VRALRAWLPNRFGLQCKNSSNRLVTGHTLLMSDPGFCIKGIQLVNEAKLATWLTNANQVNPFGFTIIKHPTFVIGERPRSLDVFVLNNAVFARS
jgi:hypothetical protein